MKRTQINSSVFQTDIEHSDLLSLRHPAREVGYRLKFSDQQEVGIRLIQPEPRITCEEIYRPGGALLAVLLKNVIEPAMCQQAFDLLKTVNGDPQNRPGIIGEKARQQGVRSDGKLSDRVYVPEKVLAEYGGKADMLGYYRYRRPAKCDITGWTHRQPHLYKQVRPFVHKVNEIYRAFLPQEHARQMRYVSTIPIGWRIPETAFTTLYVLKNAPTATHLDDFDYPGGFGCMATLGSFSGGWLCFPRFRIAIDYQPGDVVLADVHQLHANFPIQEGGLRIACVFFCRKEQHRCPA